MIAHLIYSAVTAYLCVDSCVMGLMTCLIFGRCRLIKLRPWKPVGFRSECFVHEWIWHRNERKATEQPKSAVWKWRWIDIKPPWHGDFHVMHSQRRAFRQLLFSNLVIVAARKFWIFLLSVSVVWDGASTPVKIFFRLRLQNLFPCVDPPSVAKGKWFAVVLCCACLRV